MHGSSNVHDAQSPYPHVSCLQPHRHSHRCWWYIGFEYFLSASCQSMPAATAAARLRWQLQILTMG